MSDPGHVSRYALIRLLAGELAEDERRTIEGHTAECARCTTALEALRRTQAEGALAAPPLELPPRVPEHTAHHTRRRAPLLWSGGLALAASLAALVAFAPRTTPVRAKGALALHAHCLAPGASEPRPCTSGDRVSAGTAIMFEVELPEPRWVLLVGRGLTGTPAVFFPERGEAAALVSPDAHTLLPHSLVVDDAPGPEIFTLYAAPAPFTRADLASAARADITPLTLRFEK